MRRATTQNPGDQTDVASGNGRTLAASVFGSIRNDILEMRLLPGAKLRSDDLKAMYDTGTSPLREALSRLAEEGLVTSEDQRGFRVTPMTPSDYVDLTNLRRKVEILAVTNAIENGTDAWESALVGAFHHLFLAKTVSSGFPDEWAHRHSLFHEALVSACVSPRLLRIRRQLFEHFMRYQRIVPSDSINKSVLDVKNRHKEIMEAVLSRDIEKTAFLVGAHIQVVDVIMDALRGPVV